MATAQTRDLPPAIPNFTVAMRGYDRMEVDAHVQRMGSEVRLFAADRDAALRRAEDLTKQLDESRRQVEELGRQLEQARAVIAREQAKPRGESPEQAKRTLALAEANAAEVTARAEAAAETSWSKAEDIASQLHERYRTLLNDLDKQQSEIMSEHKTFRERAKDEAARLTSMAADRRKQLDAEAEQRRRQIEEDFENEIAHKRAAAFEALAKDEAIRKNEVDKRLTAAVAAAEQQINSCNHEAAELLRYRNRIAEQLRSATSLLNDAGTLLDPLPDERN